MQITVVECAGTAGDTEKPCLHDFKMNPSFKMRAVVDTQTLTGFHDFKMNPLFKRRAAAIY